MNLSQTFRDVRRLKEIINVCSKYELEWVLEKLKLKSFSSKKQEMPEEELARRLRLTMEELDGTFIKFGQLLSVRPDLLPKSFCEEFSKLQDSVHPVEFEEIKEIVESELKKPLSVLFSAFEEVPVASASVGQVHKAKLKDGTIVAVKVQRPNIKKSFEVDIDLLYHLASLIEKNIPEAKEFSPSLIVKEFEKYTIDELNYTHEARNIELFSRNYQGSPRITIPKVFWDFSSKKVLTMSFIEGQKISNLKSFNKVNSSREKVLANVVHALTEQVVEFGFFHGDPHPGNIVVINNNRIGFLDFGIVGIIPEDVQPQLEKLFIAVVNSDRDAFADGLVNIGMVDDSVDASMFRQDLSSKLGRYQHASIKELDMASLLYDSLALARKYHMKLPLSFVLLVKSIITIQGLGRSLDPNFNFVNASKPFVEELIAERARPENVLRRVSSKFLKVADTLSSLPEDAQKTLRELRKGRVKISIDDPYVKDLGNNIDRSSNRITFGLLVAAFVVSAALVMIAKLPPYYNNIPIIAIVLLILAALSLSFLIISIAREKKR